MKRRFQRLLSILAAVTFVLTTFDYLCVDGKLLAKAFITLEDGDGLATLEELWIGDKK